MQLSCGATSASSEKCPGKDFNLSCTCERPRDFQAMVGGKILSSSERWEPFPEDSTFLESVLAVKTAGRPFLKPSLWIFSHFYVEYFLYQALDSGFASSGQVHNQPLGRYSLSLLISILWQYLSFSPDYVTHWLYKLQNYQKVHQ